MILYYSLTDTKKPLIISSFFVGKVLRRVIIVGIIAICGFIKAVDTFRVIAFIKALFVVLMGVTHIVIEQLTPRYLPKSYQDLP